MPLSSFCQAVGCQSINTSINNVSVHSSAPARVTSIKAPKHYYIPTRLGNAMDGLGVDKINEHNNNDEIMTNLEELSWSCSTLSTDLWGFSPPRWSSLTGDTCSSFWAQDIFTNKTANCSSVSKFEKRKSWADDLPLTTSHLCSSKDLSRIPLRFWQNALLVLNWDSLLFIIFLVVA